MDSHGSYKTSCGKEMLERLTQFVKITRKLNEVRSKTYQCVWKVAIWCLYEQLAESLQLCKNVAHFCTGWQKYFLSA